MAASEDDFRIGALAAALARRGADAERLARLHPESDRVLDLLASPAPVAVVLGVELRDAGFALPSWRSVTGRADAACAREYYTARRELDARRRASREGVR